ncbi:acyloxyacyl hydrolase [Edaphobacter sp. HDX4]
MLGGQAGKVLTPNVGPGILHGNFEYGIQFFPFWQSYTPRFERRKCTAPGACSAAYEVGGTYTGLSITPILLRWNFTGSGRRKLVPWAQGGGGMIWTNHKYPAVGGPPYNEITNGSAANTSVWNFTPQFGVGLHYFLRPNRSLDFGANAIHISSSSLGDKNPGVNASIQFSLGYTWWK